MCSMAPKAKDFRKFCRTSRHEDADGNAADEAALWSSAVVSSSEAQRLVPGLSLAGLRTDVNKVQTPISHRTRHFMGRKGMSGRLERPCFCRCREDLTLMTAAAAERVKMCMRMSCLRRASTSIRVWS